MLRLGEIVPNFKAPPYPNIAALDGKFVTLVPLSAKNHAAALYKAFGHDKHHENWTYLPYGPFENAQAYQAWVERANHDLKAVFFAIIPKDQQHPTGVSSYLRIVPQEARIEIGHLHFSASLQKTTAATETIFLMIEWAFQAGYRRVEWKCNALNLASRKAAQRLGFSYEGTFRQMTVQKGCNRDTAWFAIIDKEWNALKACYQAYFDTNNFDGQGKEKSSLRLKTRPLLYRLDDFDKIG